MEQTEKGNGDEKRSWFRWRDWALGALLGLAIYVMLRGVPAVIASHQVNEQLEAIRRSGDPVLATDLAESMPPPNENAAVFYKRAHEALRLTDDDDEFLSSVTKRVLAGNPEPDDAAQVRRLVRANQQALALVAQGNQLEHNVPEVDWAKGPYVELPMLYEDRKLSRLLADQLVLAGFENRPEALVAGLHESLRLADRTRADYGTIAAFVQCAQRAIALRGLEAGLRLTRPSVEQLHTVYEALAKPDPLADMAQAVVGERANGVSAINLARRVHASVSGLVGDAKPQGLCALGEYLWYYTSGPAKNELRYLRLTGEGIAMMRQLAADPTARLDLDAPDRELDEDHRNGLFAVILMPSFSGMADKAREAQAKLSATRCGLAVVAFQGRMGKDPASLDEVEKTLGWKLPLDPGSGKAFKLVCDGKLLRVESVLTENAGQGKTRQISFSVPAV